MWRQQTGLEAAMPEEFNAATQLSLKSTSDALHAEFEGVHPAERINAVFDDSVKQISENSTVESFVPAIAGRLCRERLRALA
jgi:Protein-tyrosine-phosphatase-like, N-terminal domain